MTAATPITPRTLALTDRGFDDHGDAVIVLPTEAIQIPPLLARCYLGLGWSERPGLERLDLDASALCHDASGALVDVVSFEQLRNRSAVMDASIVHSGDVLSGRRAPPEGWAARGADADLERIYFQLPKLDDAVCAVSLVINVFTSGRSFGDVGAAHCRLVNADTEQEIGRFSLRELGACEALVFARFVRQPDGRWDWLALGQPARGRVARETAAQIATEPRLQAATAAAARGVGTRPTRARAAPALIAASAAGVAAAALIFASPALELDMLTDVGDNLAGALAEAGNLIPVELIPELDLMPPGEAAAEFGELAGSAVDGAGDALGAMGDVLGAIDVGAIAGAAADAGGAVVDVAADAGDVVVDAGGAIVDVGAEGGDALCACCAQLGDVVSNIPWDDIGACFESVFGAIGSILDGFGGGE